MNSVPNNRNIRAVCSFLWVSLILIPPVRHTLETFAAFAWPTIAPFSYATNFHTFPVPFMVLIAAGYLMTYAALLFLAKNVDDLAFHLSGSGQSPLFNIMALAATIAWLLALSTLGQAGYHHFVVAFLIVTAFNPIHESSPLPAPRPLSRWIGSRSASAAW